MWFQLFLLFALIITGTFAYGAIKGAPFVPMRKKDVARFIGLLDIQPGEVMFDLGCGDGRILEAAVRKGAKAIGYELSTLPYLYARFRAWRVKRFNGGEMFVYHRDLWKSDLSSADYVYVFQLPKVNEQMKAKLVKEMKPGAKVLTYVFQFKDWTPVKMSRAENEASIYVYEIGKSNLPTV